MVNFASLRSAYDVTMEAMNCPSLKTIAIIAEGIPENFTRNIIKTANEKVKKNKISTYGSLCLNYYNMSKKVMDTNQTMTFQLLNIFYASS